MKIFLDANVLVAILNKEYPTFSFAARILSLADNKDYKIYTSAICLARAFYFSEKKSGNKMAKTKIELLVNKINIAEVGKEEVMLSLQNKKINDIEDGFEYFAALHSKCDIIVTEDISDFYFSKLPILNCKDFIKEYLLHN
jgi:predicted nucleic acid-binding protein